MNPHREAPARGVGPDLHVGPIVECPACGEEQHYGSVTGEHRGGPSKARVCTDPMCADGSLAIMHLHQSCKDCDHAWAVAPVGLRPDPEPRKPDREFAAAVTYGIVIGAFILSAVAFGMRLAGLL